MNSKTLLLIPATLALGFATSAHAYIGFGLNLGIPLYYPAPVYRQTVAYQATPASASEVITPAPGPGYVWLSGHWSNQSQRWVWLSGHWEVPPSPSALWIAGHWVQGNAGWVWVDGAWTIGSPPQAPSGTPAIPAPPAQPLAGQANSPSAAVVAVPSTPPPTPEMADGTVVEADPPAPIVEYVPDAVYPGFVWVGGFWGWRGGWYWNAGHFSRAPFRGAAWVSGGWARGARGWAWHGGRWR
jgi:hypothetical protein